MPPADGVIRKLIDGIASATPPGMMCAADVLQIVDALRAAGVRLWLDGGWAVDAALERQTREHDDLDVVLPLGQAEAVRSVLATLGFSFVEDERTACFVARDASDRRVDVHTVIFDEEGGGLQRQEDGSFWRYPPEAFAGRGRVAGRELACLPPEVQRLCHLTYAPDDTDRRDMHLLAARFGLTLPPPYAE